VQTRWLRRAVEGDEAHPVEASASGFLDFWQKETTIHLRGYEPTRT
jgi:hypothetical protein